MNKTLGVFSLAVLCNLWGNAQSTKDTLLADTANQVDVFSITLEELENQVDDQNVSGVLSAGRDVFSAYAAFNLSSGGYRVRGYDSRFQTILLNGVEVNNPYLGYARWSDWGGLNDITRYQESENGLHSNDYSFSQVAGASRININASNVRKGARASYAFSNRSYQHRAMLTYASGWTKNNWYFSFSGSRRFANEGFVEGTFYDGASYFLAAEKKWGNHQTSLTLMGAPYYRGKSSLAVQEAYDLTGTNYYNSYWGYQEGVKRNSRVNHNHRPIVVLTDQWKVNDKHDFYSNTFFSTGEYLNTRLNWADASDPRPDYYKYLPSYFIDDATAFQNITQNWMSDINTQQLDWNKMHQANYKNLYTINNEGGTGEDLTGNRAKYVVEEDVFDLTRIIQNLRLKSNINENLVITNGFKYDYYNVVNFKRLDDLLGADYWLDIDRFAEQDNGSDDNLQNDLQNPNKAIRKGDVFGYHYALKSRKASYFGQANYSKSKIDAYVGLQLESSSFWREGYMQKGTFSDNSLGNSEKAKFNTFGVKGGLVYKLTGRHILSANGMYSQVAPLMRNAFLSPRFRNDIINGLTIETVKSIDVNYTIKYANFKSKITAFVTNFENQSKITSYYHDEYNTFVNYIMTGIDQYHAGLEWGGEYSPISEITFSSAIGVGQYLYNSRPTATVMRDNTNEILAENKTIYIQNYRLGNMPQTAGSIGIKYSSPKYWFTGLNFNYFQDNYLSINPDRRTEEAVAGYVDTDTQFANMIDQMQLQNQKTVDFYFGGSRKIKGNYLRLFASVNNVLDNKDLIRFAFEQLRYDVTNIDKFPPKYAYAYGRTYYLMLTYQF